MISEKMEVHFGVISFHLHPPHHSTCCLLCQLCMLSCLSTPWLICAPLVEDLPILLRPLRQMYRTKEHREAGQDGGGCASAGRWAKARLLQPCSSAAPKMLDAAVAVVVPVVVRAPSSYSMQYARRGRRWMVAWPAALRTPCSRASLRCGCARRNRYQ